MAGKKIVKKSYAKPVQKVIKKKEAKLSWDDFLNEWQAKNRAGNMNENKHHPDVHYLGASPGQCPGCDVSKPSAKHIFANI